MYILQRIETSGQDKQKWRVFVSQIAWTCTISNEIIKKNEKYFKLFFSRGTLDSTNFYQIQLGTKHLSVKKI